MTQPTSAAQKVDINSLKDRRYKLEVQIQKIEDVERRQQLAVHAGKYYKYNNSYSPDRRWWLYTHVLGINKSDTSLRLFKFEIDCDGRIRIESEKYGYESSLQTQITKGEFNRAWKKVLAAIARATREDV